jgi:hypothetical protein
MRRYREKITVLAAIFLTTACLSRGVIAADNGAVNASFCAIAAERNATNNAVTCNFGL